jgi:hypothetical protein
VNKELREHREQQDLVGQAVRQDLAEQVVLTEHKEHKVL